MKRSKQQILDELLGVAAGVTVGKFKAKAMKEIAAQLDELLPDKLDHYVTPADAENRAQLTAAAYQNTTMEACVRKLLTRAGELFTRGRDDIAIAIRTLATELEADRQPVKMEHERLLKEVCERDRGKK